MLNVYPMIIRYSVKGGGVGVACIDSAIRANRPVPRTNTPLARAT